MGKSARPRLTIKAAKAIAIQELGTAAKLTPHKTNSAEFQSYEIRIGSFTAVISQAFKYPGVAYISYAGIRVYYDVKTQQVNYKITDAERRNDRRECVKEVIRNDRWYIVKSLVDEYGREPCHKMLDAAL